MEITIIFKIALVGILVTILNQILKQSGRDEQAFIVSLAGKDPDNEPHYQPEHTGRS